MSDSKDRQEPWLKRVREEYRATLPLESGAKERLEKILGSESSPRSPRWRLWFGPGSPPRTWAMAAGFLALVGALAWVARSDLERSKLTGRDSRRARSAVAENESTSVVRFVLSAPGASQVSLVGDFNAWDAAAAPMRRVDSRVWAVALPVRHGRHVYAFLVDKERWMSDPDAPLAPEDGFGVPNSVIVVGGPGGT
jgi:predicted carbohydrate-binding protein with CBM48